MALIEENQNNVISDVYSKLRILENKNNILGEHLLTINQNTIEEYKKLNRDIKMIKEAPNYRLA